VEKSAFPDVVSNKDGSEELCALMMYFLRGIVGGGLGCESLVKLRWILTLFCYNRREYGQTKYLNPEWGYWWIENKENVTL
jgi:hypothetical protein